MAKSLFAADMFAAGMFRSGLFRGGAAVEQGHVGGPIRRRFRPATAKVQTAKLFLYAHAPRPQAGAAPRMSPLVVTARALRVRPRAKASASVRTQYPLMASRQPAIQARGVASVRTVTVETMPFGSKREHAKALRILDEAFLLNQ